jgi:hypothetical protein
LVKDLKPEKIGLRAKFNPQYSCPNNIVDPNFIGKELICQ